MMSKKMSETLTENDYVAMFSGQAVGIFNSVIKNADEFVSVKEDLCLTYYTCRSALKTISPCYELLLQKLSKQDADARLSEIIRARYLLKWKRLYDALNLNYGVLEGFEETRRIQDNHTDTDTTSNNTIANGNNGTETKTTSSVEVEDDVYGFNSEEAVHKGKTSTTENQEVTEDSTKNTSYNSESFAGTNTNRFDGTKDESVKGRHDTAQKLINEEIRLRNLTNFIDIVCADIDSVATIQIYL